MRVRVGGGAADTEEMRVTGMKSIGKTGGITDTPAEATALAEAAVLGEEAQAPDVPVTGERAVGSAGGTEEKGVVVAEVRAGGEGTGGDR